MLNNLGRLEKLVNDMGHNVNQKLNHTEKEENSIKNNQGIMQDQLTHILNFLKGDNTVQNLSGNDMQSAYNNNDNLMQQNKDENRVLTSTRVPTSVGSTQLSNSQFGQISSIPHAGYLFNPQVPIGMGGGVLNRTHNINNIPRSSIVPTLPLSAMGVSGASAPGITTQAGSGNFATQVFSNTFNVPTSNVNNKITTPQPPDMVSVLFSTTVAPAVAVTAAAPAVSALNNSVFPPHATKIATGFGCSRKVILAPFALGQPRTFREFLVEYEEAVRRTGQGDNALPIILREHLRDAALDQYDMHYSAGMSYDLLKSQLLPAFQELEANYKHPSVDPSIGFNNKIGTYGLLICIIRDLRRFGNTEHIRRLTVDEFWKRLPKEMVPVLYAATQADKEYYNLPEVDINCLYRATKEVDRANNFAHKLATISTSQTTPAPSPLASYLPDYSQAAAFYQPQVDSYDNNNYFAFAAASQPLQATAQPQPIYSQQFSRGGQNGGSRGNSNSYYRGGNRGGRGYHDGYGSGYDYGYGSGYSGYGRGYGYRGGYRGRGANNNVNTGVGKKETKCWKCNKIGHLVGSCPEIDMPYRPNCPRCGQKHPTGRCRQGNSNASTCVPTSSASTIVNSPATTSSPCKLLKRCHRTRENIGISKVGKNKVLAINWSNFPELDQMNSVNDNNFELLPSEEVCFDFEVYAPPPEDSYKKPNKSTFFIKDMPKCIEEELKDTQIRFNNVTCHINKKALSMCL